MIDDSAMYGPTAGTIGLGKMGSGTGSTEVRSDVGTLMPSTDFKGDSINSVSAPVLPSGLEPEFRTDLV